MSCVTAQTGLSGNFQVKHLLSNHKYSINAYSRHKPHTNKRVTSEFAPTLPHEDAMRQATSQSSKP
jgi:hypothetical protein